MVLTQPRCVGECELMALARRAPNSSRLTKGLLVLLLAGGWHWSCSARIHQGGLSFTAFPSLHLDRSRQRQRCTRRYRSLVVRLCLVGNKEEAFQVLGLRPSESTSTEIRQAFRKAAAKAHPDVASGSEEAFRRVVEAYNVALSEEPEQEDPSWLSGKAPRKSKVNDDVDDFLSTWAAMGKDVKGWGDFEQIEQDTDDDGWCDREPVLNAFVRRHDAAFDGGVQEGNLVIYRLMQATEAGLGWGLGRVLALQICYASTGPNGLLYVQPQRLGGRSSEGCIVVDDEDAEVSMTRAVDRLEVLQDATELADGTTCIRDGSRAALRALYSGMVFLGSHDMLEAGDPKRI
eukprot:TRINITY_DN47459_c0_g1_i1.p1 TRINITY_DN47459_c0_g1~~TRINITY_DN47459_c0_g1_i1.p1  ORF type:complete len:346 (-),score=52.18 TRINITY_DN47459_c0_g1_i1:101-1138(-)